jgi:hypothetical protein
VRANTACPARPATWAVGQQREEANMSNQNNQGNTTAIIVAIIGVIGAIATGFFSYKAGTAQVEIPIRATQTAEAKQTPTNSASADIVSIEDMQFLAEPYTIGDDVSSHLSIYNGKSGTDYQLQYSVPQINDEFAGFFFRMEDSENLENFNYAEVTVSFEDDSASLEMYIKDITMPWGVPVIRIGKTVNYQSGVKVTQEGDDYTIKIPLSTFAPLDLKAIKEIGFYAGAFSSGTSSFTIKKLLFTKE